jgi:transposase
MQTVSTIGLDIAKSLFQVHGIDAAGQVVIRRQLKRRYLLAFFEKLPRCLIGIEACASSHHWSRELQALGGDAPRLVAGEQMRRRATVWRPPRRWGNRPASLWIAEDFGCCASG